MKQEPQKTEEDIVEETIKKYFPLEFFLTENCPVRPGELYGDLHYERWSEEQKTSALHKQNIVRKVIHFCVAQREQTVREEYEHLVDHLFDVHYCNCDLTPNDTDRV